jgi:outer membrane protein insertion porin family
MKSIPLIILILIISSMGRVFGQDTIPPRTAVIDYNSPQTYVVGGISVTGVQYLGEEQMISLTGITKGDKIEIPGDDLSSIIKRIWAQRFFSDVAFYIDSTVKDTVYLNLYPVGNLKVSGREKGLNWKNV